VLAAVLIALVCWVAKLNQPDPNLPATGPRAAVYQYQQPAIDRKTAPRAEPMLFNHPAQDPLLEPPQAIRRAVLVRLPTGVRVMRAELVNYQLDITRRAQPTLSAKPLVLHGSRE
jgi:hypothetical protein